MQREPGAVDAGTLVEVSVDVDLDQIRRSHLGPEQLVGRAEVGDLVRARVIESEGVDLVAARL